MRHPRAVQGVLDAAVTRLDDVGRHGADEGVERLGADRVYHALADFLRVQTGGGQAFRERSFVIGPICGPPI